MHFRSSVGAILAAVAITAGATQQRSFVASTGLDTNNCTLTAPCRSFASAINQTLDDGEVIVLDSAGYGPVAITKGISIVAPSGVYAGITVFAGNGVTIDTLGIHEAELRHVLNLIGPHFARCGTEGLASPRVASLLKVCRRRTSHHPTIPSAPTVTTVP